MPKCSNNEKSILEFSSPLTILYKSFCGFSAMSVAEARWSNEDKIAAFESSIRNKEEVKLQGNSKDFVC